MSDITWTSAPQTWATANGSFGKPTLLRFASDSFMKDFMSMLENQPDNLPSYQVKAENWMRPMDGPSPVKLVSAPIRQLQLRRAGVLGALASRALVTQEDVASLSLPVSTDLPLKLYQPSHMRYYLVTASLVCQEVGMPDRVVDASAQEKTSFVVRRLMLKNPSAYPAGTTPPTPTTAPGEYEEYALVDVNGVKAWQKQANPRLLATNEEQNALFAINFTQSDGRRRRLLSGLVPTGKRETYIGATPSSTAQASQPPATQTTATTQDPRLDMQARRLFFGPWQQLIENMDDLVQRSLDDLAEDNDTDHTKSQRDLLAKTRLRLQESSWYLMLDFANFLQEQLPDLMAALESGSSGSNLTTEKPLFDALNKVKLYKAGSIDIPKVLNDQYGVQPLESLGKALGKIRQYNSQLESVSTPYNGSGRGTTWPNFIFPLVDVSSANCASNASPVQASPFLSIAQEPPFVSGADNYLKAIDDLRQILLDALPLKSTTPLPPVPLNSLPPARIDETAWFVIRCAFERPNCLPTPEPVISDATPPFQIAGFFDPDAPARPLRIDLPIDTSPAGLRKFDKNTAFMVSDMLCGQVKRARSLGLGDLIRSVLPFPLHKDLDISSEPCSDGGVTFGMICSLSIPIITICAFIMLMVIVTLLDFIFRWIPYFILCFPLPKFGSKESA